jgi:hypothetical protein
MGRLVLKRVEITYSLNRIAYTASGHKFKLLLTKSSQHAEVIVQQKPQIIMLQNDTKYFPGALIVLDVHGITVLENLYKDKCFTTADFNWSKQLRYYWWSEETPFVTSKGIEIQDDCLLRQTIAGYKYR